MGETGTAKRTHGATHGERRIASGAALALLDQLDDLVARRDKALGDLGNATGKLRAAEQDVERRAVELDGLEDRAARTRRAYEVLHGHDEEVS